MESLPFLLLLQGPIPSPRLSILHPHLPRRHPPPSALRRRRGFGPPLRNPKKPTTRKTQNDEDDDEEEEEADYDVVIPEVVTDRMMRRVGLSVGIPLATGLLFFPFFYYLKVVAKVDVPNWVPFIVSFLFFGAALLGISYGIVSASWDPVREGSVLGWNEARRNWPVFWQSLRAGGDKK